MRASWDEYFVRLAHVVATRSTCDRRHVGCIFVSPEHHILATGYNGSVHGHDHCDDVGHMMDANNSCVRTIHAEQNAIVHAASTGVHLRGSTVYITHSPCWTCTKLLLNVEVARIVYSEFYRDDRVFDACKKSGVPVDQYIDETNMKILEELRALKAQPKTPSTPPESTGFGAVSESESESEAEAVRQAHLDAPSGGSSGFYFESKTTRSRYRSITV